MSALYDFSKRLLRSSKDAENVADGHPAAIVEFPRKVRIETQIHRRRAAKAFSRLITEWGKEKPAPPDEHADQEQP